MTRIQSTPQTKQPLDHDDWWATFKHVVSAAMSEVGWSGGPLWEREDAATFTPLCPVNVPVDRFDEWAANLARAVELAATATGVRCNFVNDWPATKEQA